MKTLARGLHRLPTVVVATSGMFTDPHVAEIQSAREALLDRLAPAPEGSVVPLSLEGVELSASCLASVLVPVLSAIVGGHLQRKYVVVIDPTGRNKWDGDAGLKKESERLDRKLVCVWQAKQTELAGPVDTQVRATYEFVLSSWRKDSDGATARDLAEHFDVSIQAASNRLAKASGLGLLHAADREVVSGGGAQYVFVPVV
jgi:hypothetical protein